MPRRRRSYPTSRRQADRRRATRYRRRARSRLMRMRISPSRTVHKWHRKMYKQTILASATGVTTGALSFKFDDMTNYAEFQSLADQYTLTTIKVTFIPRYSGSEVPAPAGFGIPFIHLITDHDDANPPSTTLNTFLENSKVKSRRLIKPITMLVKPSILQEVYRGVATTSYAPKFRQKLDIAHVDVPHYGLKYFIDHPGLVSAETLCDVYFDFWFTTHGVR